LGLFKPIQHVLQKATKKETVMGKTGVNRRYTPALHKWVRAYIVSMPLFSVALVAIWRNMAVDDSSLLWKPAVHVTTERELGGDRLSAPKSNDVTQQQQHLPSQPTTEQQSTVDKRIPNILIAGAQKASTSSIANYIKDKLGVCFSDPSFNLLDGKEAHFFDYPRSYRGGLPVYQHKFAYCRSDQQLLDGTPDTMVYADQVKKIYDEHGSTKELKVVFILREPVSREISRYNHQLRLARSPNPSTGWGKQIIQRNGTIKTFLEDAQVQIIRPIITHKLDDQKSCYAHHLRRWFELFDRQHQILVLSYDELKVNQTMFLRRLHEFLDIPMSDEEAATMVLPHKNTNPDPTSTGPPPCDDQMTIARLFEPLNEDLYRLLAEYPGPSMEQRPFPRFPPPACSSSSSTTGDVAAAT
jgi:Sulfotransferase domain